MSVLSVAVMSYAAVYVLLNIHEMIRIGAPSPVASALQMPLPSVYSPIIPYLDSCLQPIYTLARGIYQKLQDGPCHSLASVFGCFPLTVCSVWTPW